MNSTELTTRSVQSRAMFLSALLIAERYNITIGGKFIGWQLLNSSGNAMNALSKACKVVSNSNIVGIVGPAVSRESHVIAPFAEKLGIPVISYAATDPELSDKKIFPTFYRTTPADNTAALAIAELFVRYHWTSCIIVYQNDAFGSGGVKAISEAFNRNSLKVTQTIAFDIGTRSIQGDLKSLLTSSTVRIVILWAEPNYVPLILQNALDSDTLAPQFTWILSATIPLNTIERKYYDKLTGILTVEPVVGGAINAPINTTLLNEAFQIWQEYEPSSFPGANNVNDYALFSFDATWTLIQSLQKFCPSNTPCISFANTSFCFERQLLNSDSLFTLMDHTNFLGVSGTVEFGVNSTERTNGTYYIVKNLRTFDNKLEYFPVLVWTNSRTWTAHAQANTIVWPGNSLKVPTGYAAIKDVTLRIAVIETAPFTMKTESQDQYGNTTYKLTGYIPDLIDDLQKAMGFVADIIWLPANQTYNGLIDAVASDKYDLVMGDVTILAERREKVDFSTAILENSLRIIMRDTFNRKVNYAAFLKPFSYQIWLVSLGALLCAAILLYSFEGRHNEKLKQRPFVSRIVLSLHFATGTIFGNNVDYHVKTLAGRLLVIGLFILSMVLIAAYQANLTAILTVSQSETIISGIDDIKNGKIPFHRIGILVESSIEDFYLREVSRGERNYYPVHSKEEMYSKLLDKTVDASIMDAGVLEYTINSVYCNLTLVGPDFDHSAFGIVSPKDWLYGRDFDVNILELREKGIIDDLKQKWFQRDRCSRSTAGSDALEIGAMAGLFITFAGISIISLLVYAIESCVSWKQPRYVSATTRATQTDCDDFMAIENTISKRVHRRMALCSCGTQTDFDSSIAFDDRGQPKAIKKRISTISSEIDTVSINSSHITVTIH